MKPIAIYDRITRKRLAFLENANNISYMQQTNATWTGSFRLPSIDEKKQYCELLNFVELWDIDGGGNDKYVGLFRIIEIIEETGDGTDYITYTLEHVIGTLIESNLVGYRLYETNTIGEIITSLLAMQEEEFWVLNECDYTKVLEYEFEDMNLLSCLTSVTEMLNEKHYWTFNTQNFPWEMNLKKVSTTVPVTDVRYKKNIFKITKRKDTRSLCTKLWLYGAEINGAKVNISSVNNGDEFLVSSTGISAYGTIGMIINDDRFTKPKQLYNYGVALLAQLDKPLITYETTIEAINEGANLKIGDAVRIITDDGLDDILIVQEINKQDISGAPNSGKITIGQGAVNIGLITKKFT